MAEIHLGHHRDLGDLHAAEKGTTAYAKRRARMVAYREVNGQAAARPATDGAVGRVVTSCSNLRTNRASRTIVTLPGVATGVANGPGNPWTPMDDDQRETQ